MLRLIEFFFFKWRHSWKQTFGSNSPLLGQKDFHTATNTLFQWLKGVCLLLIACLSKTTCGLFNTNVRVAILATLMLNKTWPMRLHSLSWLFEFSWNYGTHNTTPKKSHSVWTCHQTLSTDSTVPLLLSSGRRLEVNEFVMLSTLVMNGCCAA